MELSPAFVASVTGAWPSDGPAFLARLPTLIKYCEQRWNLRALAPFPLSYNYVAPVVRADGSEAVLKLGVPNPELSSEIEALRLYDSQGAAALYEADPDLGALLMERVRPGEPLAGLPDDDEATLVAGQMMQKLWRPLPPQHRFPDLARWTRALRQYPERHVATKGEGPLPPAMIATALGLLGELLTDAHPPVLIHGDFHHWNVLRGEREPWLVIDPKGVAAEPAFEVGPLLYNPPDVLGWPDLERVTRRRLDILRELLGLDRQRLVACALVGAVLSACWSIEDGDGGAPGVLVLAQILARA